MYEFEYDYDPKQQLSDPDPRVRAIEQAFRRAENITKIADTASATTVHYEANPYASSEETRPDTHAPRPDNWRNLPA